MGLLPTRGGRWKTEWKEGLFEKLTWLYLHSMRWGRQSAVTEWTKRFESPHKIKRSLFLCCSLKHMLSRRKCRMRYHIFTQIPACSGMSLLFMSHKRKYLPIFTPFLYKKKWEKQMILCNSTTALFTEHLICCTLYTIYSTSLPPIAPSFPSSQPDTNSSLIDPTLRLLTGSRHMVMWDSLDVDALSHHTLWRAGGVARWCHPFRPTYAVRGRTGRGQKPLTSAPQTTKRCFFNIFTIKKKKKHLFLVHI